MKALVATRFGASPEMRIEDRDKPAARDGFALVKMHAATVNPLSAQVRSGRVDGAHAPRVLSNDGAGIVEHGSRFAPGTRVAVYGGSQLGITEDGLQQQWVSVADKRLFALPDELDLDAGAALAINYVTAYQAPQVPQFVPKISRAGCWGRQRSQRVEGNGGNDRSKVMLCHVVKCLWLLVMRVA